MPAQLIWQAGRWVFVSPPRKQFWKMIFQVTFFFPAFWWYFKMMWNTSSLDKRGGYNSKYLSHDCYQRNEFNWRLLWGPNFRVARVCHLETRSSLVKLTCSPKERQQKTRAGQSLGGNISLNCSNQSWRGVISFLVDPRASGTNISLVRSEGTSASARSFRVIQESHKKLLI